MSLGRCIEGDTGYLGCFSNQLPSLDSQCSGRQHCEIGVFGIEASTNCSIPNYFTKYLEAKYTCQKGKWMLCVHINVYVLLQVVVLLLF